MGTHGYVLIRRQQATRRDMARAVGGRPYSSADELYIRAGKRTPFFTYTEIKSYTIFANHTLPVPSDPNHRKCIPVSPSPPETPSLARLTERLHEQLKTKV